MAAWSSSFAVRRLGGLLGHGPAGGAATRASCPCETSMNSRSRPEHARDHLELADLAERPRPGGGRVLLREVVGGVTRRTGMVGREMTTAWVEVGRRVRVIGCARARRGWAGCRRHGHGGAGPGRPPGEAGACGATGACGAATGEASGRLGRRPGLGLGGLGDRGFLDLRLDGPRASAGHLDRGRADGGAAAGAPARRGRACAPRTRARHGLGAAGFGLRLPDDLLVGGHGLVVLEGRGVALHVVAQGVELLHELLVRELDPRLLELLAQLVHSLLRHEPVS